MPTCADILARTLVDAGITRIFGLPGGEILDFMEAGRRAGLEFLLTRHEATASLMADVTGQISGKPGVCVATPGPGAVNMALGVANAFLDRSPLSAITAAHATTAVPYATHQKLDLNAVYRPFTKLAIALDGIDTALKVQHAIAVSLAPRLTSQAWTAFEPLSLFESNGLSAMSYSLPAAMAARLLFPPRPILCTIGDGGFGMTMADIETCVRERLNFVTVETMEQLDAAVTECLRAERPVVIDAPVDPSEYAAHTAAARRPDE